MSRINLYLLIVFVFSVVFIVSSCSPTVGEKKKPKKGTIDTTSAIDIDLSINHYPAKPRASGLLFGINTERQPLDMWIFPLHIPVYRFTLAPKANVYQRIKNWDVQKEVILFKSYGRPPWNRVPRPGTNSDYSQWKDTVAAVVSRNLAMGWGGKDRVYDIWNEPDNNHQRYWDGTRAGYLKTWAKAAKVIHRLDPNALIAGPTFGHFDLKGITQFLNYMKQRGILPDIVTWHEFRQPAHTSVIQSDVEKYRSSPNNTLVSRIQINEYGWGGGVMFVPGILVHYIASIDRSQVDAAVRGSWGGGPGDGTLSGLLTNNHAPTPAWWVYRYYAVMTTAKNATMIAFSPWNENIDGIASFTNGSKVYILLGNRGNTRIKLPIVLKNYMKVIGSLPSTVSITTLHNNRHSLLTPESTHLEFKLDKGNVIFRVNIPAKCAVFIRLS